MPNCFPMPHSDLGWRSGAGVRSALRCTSPKSIVNMRDLQELAGHANLRTTQRYTAANPDAQMKVVGLV